MALRELRYAALPDAIKNNLTEEQFQLARVDVIEEGETIPETTEYIDLGSGVRRVHHRGEAATGNLLPTHDLSGAHGKDSSQWQS
ncbi:MAG: hypothetical protein M1380_06435 [Chloroflexi bacterium]|nr:hypothetical protein [Chloroflexota bacterium]